MASLQTVQECIKRGNAALTSQNFERAAQVHLPSSLHPK